MSFIDKFVQGEIDFGTEEKREVMNKTVSVSTDPSEEKIKVDHLDSNNSMEKDFFWMIFLERFYFYIFFVLDIIIYSIIQLNIINFYYLIYSRKDFIF